MKSQNYFSNNLAFLFRHIGKLAFLLSIMCASSLKAQEDWDVDGNVLTGATNSPPQFIGTTSNHDWIIRTFDTEKMRVTAGGNVGIGVPAPVSRLSVNGAIQSASVVSTTGGGGTILYGATNETGVPNEDGFRFAWDPDFFASFNDALVFQKTDGNNASPDLGASGMAFVNTGNTGITQTAMVIKGNGQVGLGNIYGQGFSPIQSPGNVLEINGTPGNIGNTGASGLRFRNLTSASPSIANPGAGVLSVNASGDVIYVNNPSGASLIGLCSALPALPSDAGLDLGGNDFYFANSNGNVGIGYGCTPLSAKLDVLNVNQPSAGRFISNYPTAGAKFGISVGSQGTGFANIGLNSNASGASINAAINAAASGAPGSTNIGVSTSVTGTIGTNIALRASSPTVSDGSINTTNLAILSVGDEVVLGDFMVLSDARLKDNIEPIQNATEIISKLNPKTYNFRTQEAPSLNMSHSKQFGLLSQEVETVLPELVKNIHNPAQFDTAGAEISPGMDLKVLNYVGFVPILIQGMKEQESRIQANEAEIEGLKGEISKLNERIEMMMSKMDDCCTQSGNHMEGSGNAQPASIGHRLDQNVPNPAHGGTTIKYHVANWSPETYISVSSLNGTELARFPVGKSGDGEISIPANTLSQGEYVYALFVGGQRVAWRKMLLTQ